MKLTEALNALKQRVQQTLAKAKNEFMNDKIVKEKIAEVSSLLENKFAETSNPDDDTVTFYLSLPTLEMELVNV